MTFVLHWHFCLSAFGKMVYTAFYHYLFQVALKPPVVENWKVVTRVTEKYTILLIQHWLLLLRWSLAAFHQYLFWVACLCKLPDKEEIHNFIHLNAQFSTIVAQELLIYYITVGNMKREYTYSIVMTVLKSRRQFF